MKFLQEKFLLAALSEKEAAYLRPEYVITVNGAGEEEHKSDFIASAPDKTRTPSAFQGFL